MNLKQCPNGHFYNPAMNDECPVCAGQGTGGVTAPVSFDGGYSEGSTVPLNSGDFGGYDQGVGETVPLNYDGPMGGGSISFSPIGSTTPVTPPEDPDDSEGKTIVVIKSQTGIDPVCGWLVCTEGPQRGNDFRIHDGSNHVGRSSKMDIIIKNDQSISSEGAAVITFDSRNRRFFFSAGQARNNSYLNDQVVLPGQSAELKPYDLIEIGTSKFTFVPLCGENFTWVAPEEKKG